MENQNYVVCHLRAFNKWKINTMLYVIHFVVCHLRAFNTWKINTMLYVICVQLINQHLYVIYVVSYYIVA